MKETILFSGDLKKKKMATTVCTKIQQGSLDPELASKSNVVCARLADASSRTSWANKLFEICIAMRDDTYMPEVPSTFYDKTDANRMINMKKWLETHKDQKMNANGGVNRKVIIFSYFQKVIESLSEAFAKNGQKCAMYYGGIVSSEAREKQLMLFKDPSSGVDFIFMSYSTGSLGVEVKEASGIVFADTRWTYSEQMQAVARARRSGQTRDVRVAYVFSAPSINYYIANVLHPAQKAAGEVLKNALLTGEEENAIDLENVIKIVDAKEINCVGRGEYGLMKCLGITLAQQKAAQAAARERAAQAAAAQAAGQAPEDAAEGRSQNHQQEHDDVIVISSGDEDDGDDDDEDNPIFVGEDPDEIVSTRLGSLMNKFQKLGIVHQ